MDISFYISELLDEHGEISVPGLGFFVQEYAPGYYNEAEGKFYPPHHHVQYDPQQLDDDDTLTQYIADKKNISLASSKYFTEKFINTVKEDALIKDVSLAELGWLHTEQGKLSFKSSDHVAGDPAFFGYPAISTLKIGQAPIPVNKVNNYIRMDVPEPTVTPVEQPTAAEPVLEQPVAESIIAEEPPAYMADEAETTSTELAVIEQDEELYEEPKKSYGWVIVFSILVIVALAILGMYKYYPAQYNNAMAWVQNITSPKPPAKPKTDDDKSLVAVIPKKTDTPAADTIAVNKSTAVDSNKSRVTPAETKPTAPVNTPVKQTPPPAPVKRQAKPVEVPAAPIVTGEADPKKPWVVIALNCHTAAVANAAIAKFKAEGLDAFIAPNMNGINVAVGAYASNAEADAARAKFIAAKQVPSDAYLTLIKLKK